MARLDSGNSEAARRVIDEEAFQLSARHVTPSSRSVLAGRVGAPIMSADCEPEGETALEAERAWNMRANLTPLDISTSHTIREAFR
jgi:hypothetical protein